MICRHCRVAADLLATQQTKKTIRAARELHAKCESCDCQHNVDAQRNGKAIYREAYEPVGTTNPVVE